MRRAGGWHWLLAACALWGAAGCGEPPVESTLTVELEQPADGQRLAAGDDADPAGGFQYDVVAVAADSSGRAVTLAGARLELRGASEDGWREGPAPVLEGARVRFPGVVLEARTTVLRMTVEEQGSRRTAVRTLSVTVGAELPSLGIASPPEGRVLREVDDADPLAPGYQVAFELRATALSRASGLLACEGGCGIAPVPFTVGDDGGAALQVTLPEPVHEAQLTRCVAVVRRPGGAVTSPPRLLTLDTEPPRIAIDSPVVPVASHSFPVKAVVLSAEEGATATLLREPAGALTATVSGGTVTFPAVSVPGDGSHDFRLRVADAAGNVGERAFTVLAASTAPVLSLETPVLVVTDANNDPDDGVQAEAVVRANAQPVGTEVALWTAVMAQFGQPQRSPTKAEGSERLARFTLNLAEGSNSVRACVRNAAGLQSCRNTTVDVLTGRALCRILEPTDRSTLPTGTGQVAARIEAQSGKKVTLDVLAADGSVVSSATGNAAGGIAALSVSLPSEGAWRLVATCAGGGVSQALMVFRDTTRPALTASIRDAPQGRIEPSFLDTSVMSGTQVVLEATTEPFAQVSVQGCGLTAPLTASADSLGRATLRDVTVPQLGSCGLLVRAGDLAGNETSLSVPVTSAFARPSLGFASPPPGQPIDPGDGTSLPGGRLAVPVRVAFSSGAMGELKLHRENAEVGASPVAAADTEKLFPGVVLGTGPNFLRAVLLNDAGADACASALYTVGTPP